MVTSVAALQNVPVSAVTDKCLPDGKRLLIYRIDFTALPIQPWPWPGNPTASAAHAVTFPYWTNGGMWTENWQRTTIQPGSNQIKPLSVTKSLMFTFRHFYTAAGVFENWSQNVPQDDGYYGPAGGGGTPENGAYSTNYLETAIVANNTTGHALYIAPNNLSEIAGIFPNRLVTQGCVPFFATEEDTFDVFKICNASAQQYTVGLLLLYFANFEIPPYWQTTFAAFTQ